MDIFQKFSSQYLLYYPRWQQACHLGKVPTVIQAFNIDEAKTIRMISSYTHQALRFVNARYKPDSDQIDMLSNILVSSYPNMKLTQLMLFYSKLLAGEFGKLYNTVDPLDITTRLHKFWKGECRDWETYGRDCNKWEEWQPDQTNDEEKCIDIRLYNNYGT